VAIGQFLLSDGTVSLYANDTNMYVVYSPLMIITTYIVEIGGR